MGITGETLREHLKDHAGKNGSSKKNRSENSTNNDTDPLSEFEYLRITDATDIPQPDPIIKINGEIISTACNITTFSGASKSGKSALSGIIVAGAISPDGIYDGLQGVYVEQNPTGKAVLHIDTEQSRYKHQLNVKSILRRANLKKCPKYFLSYNIRELDLNKFLETTAAICRSANKKFGGTHLIVIDGIADYIPDPNDPVPSNSIVKSFEELAIECDAPLITIVHTNPGMGPQKERGHLGSQLQRKSESVINIKTDGEYSYIVPKFLRMAGNTDIPQLQFKYDKSKGYHVDAGIRSIEKTDSDERKLNELRRMCDEVFSGQKSLTPGEAWEAVAKITGKKKRSCQDRVTEMQAQGWIIKGDDGRFRKINADDEDEE